MSQKPDSRPAGLRASLILAAAVMMLVSSACKVVGPQYTRPPAPTPSAFKEPPPDGWKEAKPNDGVLRGAWWEIYQDPQLNALEEQVNISNQNVLAEEAQFRAARAAVRVARAALYPTVTAGTSATHSRSSAAGLSASAAAGVFKNALEFPVVDFSYQPDFWGSVHRSITQSAENVQLIAATLENVRLTVQAELATYYFEVHGLDGDVDVYQKTVKSYEDYLVLTKNRFAGGVATGADVAEAETQLSTARAALTEFEVSRAQYEHAIALLVGRPPSEISIPRRALTAPPPPIPVVVPSALLERRPDIAAAERQMAVASEAIGIAQAALYPTIGLSGDGGLSGSSLLNLFNWPARFWAIAGSLSQTVYDAGSRRAVIKQKQELFDAEVATYRQTVLTSFQQVEDALSTLRILEREAAQVEDTVAASQRSLDISTYQYKAGITNYLTVITAQTAVLQSQKTAVDILSRRLTSSVSLIQAMGGGWDASKLPTVDSLTAVR